jgi:hypothetical protein
MPLPENSSDITGGITREIFFVNRGLIRFAADRVEDGGFRRSAAVGRGVPIPQGNFRGRKGLDVRMALELL